MYYFLFQQGVIFVEFCKVYLLNLLFNFIEDGEVFLSIIADLINSIIVKLEDFFTNQFLHVDCLQAESYPSPLLSCFRIWLFASNIIRNNMDYSSNVEILDTQLRCFSV